LQNLKFGKIFLFIFFLSIIFKINSMDNKIDFSLFEYKINFNLIENEEKLNKSINIQLYEFIANDSYLFQNDLITDSVDQAINFEIKKEENLVRRAEILFFGSLTISAFAGWLCFSLYNVLIYHDTFGNLRREQFLTLYLGAAVVSVSVSFSDLFIRMKTKVKGVEFY
jgi:hypothetical protein